MPHAVDKLLLASVVAAWTLLAGCAKQGSPTGGPTDELPPKLVASSPKNFSTNSRPKEILLEFDEFFELGNPDKEWIIAPPLPEKPEYKIRGKKIIIALPDSLQEATTYTINFGASIKDLHEGNVLNNFRYVFSTGDFIDSGMVAGKVQFAETTEPAADVAVGLFTLSLDSFPVDTPPLYFAKTTEQGSFDLPYLKDSQYTLLAWEDKDANQRWSTSEPLAFVPEPIVPVFDSAIVDSVPLFLYTEIPDTLQITKFRLYDNHKVLLTFNGAPNSDLEVKGDSLAFINHFGADSTVLWYAQNRTVDSIKIELQSKTLSDTLTFFPIPPSNRNRDTSFALVSNSLPKRPGDSLFLTFSEPLRQDSFLLCYNVYPDSTLDSTYAYRSIHQATRYHAQTPTTYNSQIAIKQKLPIQGLYKPHLDTLALSYAIGTPEDYGSMTVNVVANKQPLNIPHFFWVQQGKQRWQKLGNRNGLVLNNLKPGTYELYLVLDHNEDQRFTRGSLKDKRLPERVFKYPGGIDVRANWEMELEWKINAE